jgi:adenosylcobinamide-GDP ribazoletransferase
MTTEKPTDEDIPQPFNGTRLLGDIRLCWGLLSSMPWPGPARTEGQADDRDDWNESSDWQEPRDRNAPGDVHDSGNLNDSGAGIARASWAFPVVGAVIGAIGAAVFALASGLGVPPWAAALLAVGATAAASGALHEDGLADVADGFAGAFARADKLAIMRDSRIGTFGTLALILSVGVRAAALAAIAAPWAVAAALTAAHAGARAGLPAVMRALPLARPDGLAARAGVPEPATIATGAGLAALIALVILGPGTTVIALIAGAAAAAALAALARRQIGGYSGDVLGAVEQVAEIAILLAVAAA